MDVRAATAAERAPAAGRIFGAGDQAARFLDLISTGMFDPRDLLVAVEANELRGAMIAQPLTGHLAVVAPPSADDDATADALIRHALTHLQSRGTRLAQAYLDPGNDVAALERHGFRYVTQIEQRRRPNGQPERIRSPILHFARDYDISSFGETLLATYKGSLDAPEANVGATADEILAGYARSGMRWLVSLDGAPTGVLLVAENGVIGEIEYFGVVPSARGKGIGEAILHHALEHFSRRGVHAIDVYFDTRNLPAGRLYDRLGFQPFRVQNLWLRSIT